MKLDIKVTSDIIELNDNLYGLNGCRHIFNGIYITFNDIEMIITRCSLLTEFEKRIGELKMISAKEIRTLYITDSAAFKDWDIGASLLSVNYQIYLG